jgi:hypothetical protein
MVHDSRFHRSFVSAPWRQLIHVGVLSVVLICIFVCSVHRTEQGATVALMLTPFDALIHATVLQVILILLLISSGLCWTVWRTSASLRALQALRLPPPPELLKAASAIAPANAIYLLLDDRPYAACLGLWHPAIYITTGMLDHTAPEALRAAIAHEEMHRRRRDPLRLLAMRVLGSRLYLLPGAATLPDRLELRAEILADRFAQTQTSRAALAAAILAVVRGNLQNTGAVRSSPFRMNPGVAHLYGSAPATPRYSALDERLRYLTLPASSPLPPLLPLQRRSVRPLSALRAHWQLSISLAGALSLVIFLPLTTFVRSVPTILGCPLHL